MYDFFYYPDRVDYDSPKRLNLRYEEVFFDSVDKTRLWGWLICTHDAQNPKDAKGTVVHMHGNAQNMTAHWSFAEWVVKRGYNLFTFDYRGYGKSEGAPEPKGIFEDSVSALEYLSSRNDIDTDKLCVFGQSLGGMLAIAAVGAHPKGVRALLAEAPFYSYSQTIKDKFGNPDAALDDTYTAKSYIEKISPIPLMLIHGTADQVVPYSHSQRLFELAKEPKKFITIDGGTHVDSMVEQVRGRKYQDLMIDFFNKSLSD